MLKQTGIVLFILLVLSGLLTTRVVAGEPSDTLIEALILAESDGDDSAIGDTDLEDKAYGCLQIRQPCVDDVNRAHGTNYKAEDCLNNRELSIWICKRYIELYATKKRLGRTPTDQDRARIWNGGPNGWKRSSSKKYWTKVKEKLDT